MSAPNVVIVESPAKAKTINKYLGDQFYVLASYGHVRDLPSKDGSVDPDNNFAMVWAESERAKKTLKDIKDALKDATTLYLATDPDREGEAISWHILEILKDLKIAQRLEIKRVTFNQITKTSVQEAFAAPRELDTDLVDAYLARRALDYLVGFNLSPILWRKLPGARSAGRVQSVALRLVAERESEIEIFNPEEYWSIEAQLKKGGDRPFDARLTVLDDLKLKKFSITNEKDAASATKVLKETSLTVLSVDRKDVRRTPRPPFITSTLQQEASRKLGFGATKTMRTAQSLYEGIDIGGETTGLITYMRTDGITLSPEAVSSCMKLVGDTFGTKYVPAKPRIYVSKAKNAQEAHEAIRPTDVYRTPEKLRSRLNSDQFRLYELIWKRTVASTMENAVLEQMAVDIGNKNGSVQVRANGSAIKFDGFLKLYREDLDDQNEKDDNKILPPLNEGDVIIQEEVTPNQHFTQPPPRYTEASLVKKLEELGIGRPSTYASIMQVLQERNYVILESKRFIPEDRGRVVTTFLEHFFERYVQYDFTANLENTLDSIAAGETKWLDTLADFWGDFHKTVEETKGLTITEVIDALDADLDAHFFPKTTETPEPRKCPSCDDGRLGLKLGKFGAFIGCSNYPDCKHTKQLSVQNGADDGMALDGPKILGKDPETDMDVSIRKGPYGVYVQLGPKEKTEAEKAAIKAAEEEVEINPKTGKPKKKKKPKAEKPKRTAVPKDMPAADIDLEKALSLLSLPRTIGLHPESGKEMLAGIGRYGPYVKHETTFKSIPKDDDVLTIGINRAVALLATAPKKGGNSALKTLGTLDKKEITIHNGRYGPYVKHGKVMASLPKGGDPETITLDEAKDLLAKKQEKDAAKKGGKKAPAKKTAKKKAPAKKTVKKKTAAKKTKAKKET